MANVYGLPVQRLAILEEATSMGAAITGGVGIGMYPDFSISERMNPIVETIEPEPAAQAVYEQIYPIFEASYQALKPVYELMSGLRV
jgi:xylulokinase